MPLSNRYDFVLLFDVKDGNPNGDPDAGNLPRVDAETGRGLVTDVCVKRKVRNYVALTHPEIDDDETRNFGDLDASRPRHHIFVREKGVLNQEIEKSYGMSEVVKSALNEWEAWRKDKKKPRPKRHYEDVARDWMCHNFFDVRTFGAVMSTGDKEDAPDIQSKLKKTAGQVRGPVQLTFGRSIDPIVALEHSITRMAVTNERDLEKERTMGRKHTVPYGLYRTHGFVSAHLADQTGFSEDDLELLWQALADMYEHDRSAARGEMATRGLYVFKHESKLGNAHAHALFDRLAVARTDPHSPPRDFGAYSVLFDGKPLAAGETIAAAPGLTLTRRC
jgi:CRISPR-associated protein Csd2